MSGAAGHDVDGQSSPDLEFAGCLRTKDILVNSRDKLHFSFERLRICARAPSRTRNGIVMGTASIQDQAAVTSIGTLIARGDLTEVAEGIFYSPHPLPLVSQDVIAILKTSARENSRHRARFCAHPAPDAEQHDMLIVSHRDTYVAPHRHLEKSETFVVLEGAADIMLFGEQAVWKRS